MADLINKAKEKAFNKIAEENNLDPFELMARKLYESIPCYYDKNQNIFLYNKDLKKWVMGDKVDLVCISKNILKQSSLNESKMRTSFLNAVIDYARWHQPQEVPVNWVQFDDFFYDINTKEKVKVDKKYFSQIKIPHKLGETTNTPIIDQHIIKWVGEEQYKLFVQICAYCMYKSYPFARFFIFYGTGQDGKSTAGEFISRLIGSDNSCSIDIDNLNANRFEAQKLYQKTFAICGEVDYKLLKDTRKLKAITGNDPITVEFKNKSPFQYKNFAKMLWYANGVPPTYDKTQGFYRRTIVLKFPNKFSENPNPLGDISEQEYENFCLKCMDYLIDLLENCFDEKSIENKVKEYEELSNPVLKFFNENVEETSEDNILLISDLFSEYQKYAKKNAYRDFAYNDFLAMIKNINNISVDSKKIYQSDFDGQYYLSTGQFEGNYQRKVRTFINNHKIKPILSSLSSLSSHFHLDSLIRKSNGNRVDKLDKMDKTDENTITVYENMILNLVNLGVEIKKSMFLDKNTLKNCEIVLDKFLEKGLIVEIKPDVYVGVYK